MHNEAEEVRLAKTRLARFKEIKMENVYNIKLEENSPKNIVHLHEENTSKKAVSAKDIGEHEFISRHRAVHYVIDGKVQQSMIPTNEKFVT
jgi:archaellum component FlaG (FlaF/FlaG flagellin family)